MLNTFTKELESEKKRLHRKETEIEKSLFNQRQALLNEMQSLKFKESELQRQSELDRRYKHFFNVFHLLMNRATALEKEKVVSLQNLLSSKEELMVDLKRQYEEMAKVKLER